MKNNNLCRMIALMSGVGMFALPALANPQDRGAANINASAARGGKTLRPTSTQRQQDVPSQQMGGYTVTDLDGNGFIDTADLSLLLVRLGSSGDDVVTSDSDPVGASMGSASVAGMQGLHATNYLLRQDGSPTTGEGAYYSVMDVYVKFNSSVGTGSNGERIVSFFGQATTDAATYGVVKSSKFENSAGLTFQHSNSSWLPGATANGGAGNNTWDSFVAVGGRTQGVGNTANVTADTYFLNPNTGNTMVGGSNSNGIYVGPGWYQAAPTEAAYETNASAHADKMVMIGRWSLKCSDLVANGGPVKMTVWGDTTGKSTSQTGGTTMYTLASLNLKSDAQTKITASGKYWIFDSSFTGAEAGQESWTFATGYVLNFDCNGNGIEDATDIANGTASDCNTNGIPDSCDIAGGMADCNSNGVPDSCDIANGYDCNSNGVPDSCDLASGYSRDVNEDGIPDDCEHNPVLALTTDAGACSRTGAPITVDATLSGVVSPVVAGQVYVSWNPANMVLNSITAGDEPFNEMHIINQTAGTALILVSLQQGSTGVSVENKAVARLHYTVAGGACDGSGTEVGFFPDGTLPTEFTDGVGGAMVPALVASAGFKVDDGAPVLSGVPADVTVQAEAGMGSSASVALTPPTATDACSPGMTASSSRSDGASLGAPFPVGTTTVTWSATDPCSNTTTASTSVTVNNANTGDFMVSYTNSGGYAASSARTITLNIHGANGYTLKSSQAITLNYGAGTMSLTDLAVDTYDCVAIEEQGRSLRRVANMSDGGSAWSATATLVAGDVIDDEVIDVLDWGAYIVGNPNADLDGNNAINATDGGIIIANFGQQGETGCGTSFNSPPEPRSAISVAELVDRGLTDLIGADINNDGWLDMEDVRQSHNDGDLSGLDRRKVAATRGAE